VPSVKRSYHHARLSPDSVDYEKMKGALMRVHHISGVTAGAIIELRADSVWTVDKEQALISRDHGDGQTSVRQPRRPRPRGPLNGAAMAPPPQATEEGTAHCGSRA
jgi:hypothetical protein